MNDRTAQALRLLLARIDEPTGRRVADRLRLAYDGPAGLSPEQEPRWTFPTVVEEPTTPVSVLYWMLLSGDRPVAECVVRGERLPIGLRHDLAEGVVPGLRGFAAGSARTALPLAEVVGRLRALAGSGQLKAARAVVGEIRSADWPEIAREDAERAFPGFARWALLQRVDCPDGLRERLGSHPRYRNRVRQAGIYVGGPVEYLTESGRPAAEVLRVLGLGVRAFPERLAETDAVLGPLVTGELGGHEDAWAVLAELLPGFTGTVTELITTAGAVAGGGGW